jgi:hypothetical protein
VVSKELDFMRGRPLPLLAVAFLSLAACSREGDPAGQGGNSGSNGSGAGGIRATGGVPGSGGIAATGGITATGGVIGSGGVTGAGGIAATGGATSAGTTGAGGIATTGGTNSSGGSSANGGTTAAMGGSSSSGGLGTAGVTAKGGATASGGTTASGGSGQAGGSAGTGGGAAAYQGPCDVLANGCAEAFGMARAMTSKYTGPLFQIGLAKDKSKLLDIGQTSDHKADMTTWSAFCGGNASSCVVSKIYAQIHTGPNDLVPGVFKTPWNPDCSAGGFTCAGKFTIESATGLPMLTTDMPQEYSLAGDAFATGINGGTKAVGIMYNGKPVTNQVYCCGVIGITHKYNATDAAGTDFMLALAYGWKDPNGCCIAVNCGKANSYCVGAEEEENNDLFDYGTAPLDNAMVVTQFDPGPNAVITYLNGKKVMTKSPPKARLNVGTAIHLGGGGDLSQPAPVRMREALFTNNVMSDDDVQKMHANITSFFSALKYP